MTLFSLLADRLKLAVVTLPDMQGLILGIVLLAIYAAISLPIGFRSSLFRWVLIRSPYQILSTSLVAIVFPAVMEEVIFRVLLLPTPPSLPITFPPVSPIDIQIYVRFFEWSLISLVLFILAHPLNAIVFFPQRKSTFFDPIFLGLAGFLGVVCTITYLGTGSLWLPVGLHWLMVVIWLLTLGGLDRLSGKVEN